MAPLDSPDDSVGDPISRFRVSEIGEYIRHNSCQRRFKLGMDNRAIARRLPFMERLFNPLDPVLQAEGRERERRWELALLESGLIDLTGDEATDDDGWPTWETFTEAASQLQIGHPAYGREVKIGARIGSFLVEGRVDFLTISWRDGQPVLRVVECKASRRDRTYQRIQVALYRMILCRLLEHGLPVSNAILRPDEVEAVVARIDETTNEPQAILDLEPLDLSMEEADIERLLADDGELAFIARTEVDELSYQLDQKCDGCVFNVDCLPESARQRRHELLGIPATSAAALRSSGIATIDELADLDLNGEEAGAVVAHPGFTLPLDRLVALAKARRTTLPGGLERPDEYPVASLPHSPNSQLPPHEQNGQRLMRIYLAVDYDYVENRIGALSAHVTTSDWALHTPWSARSEDAPSRPDPSVVERYEVGRDEEGHRLWETRPLRGQEVIAYKGSEWTGNYDADTGAERELIQGFVRDLIDAISAQASGDSVQIHFYVWSRSEMARLIEGCSRADSRLLTSLRELLGCRETLEQLIYSCLQDEVDRRFGLGWTGRGLSVVSSLTWFGRRYHWRRTVGAGIVELDRDFTQDIFDFKTTLALGADGNWAQDSDSSAPKYRFEIRSRFHDSLPAPYWRAVWDALPNPADQTLSPQVRNAIQRYERAAEPNVLREYLRARTHALRWVEEGVRFKNDDIVKPSLRINELRRFRLGVSDVARAGIDFLRLDQFVRVTDWLAHNMQSVVTRVATGTTVPLQQVSSVGNGRLVASINLSGQQIDLPALRSRCPFGPGSMVRISPCSDDPHRGQTMRQLVRGGRTATIESIDWQTGELELSEMWTSDTRYVLLSTTSRGIGPVWTNAAMDESPSDFVAGNVEERLLSNYGRHVAQWFDPEHPGVPIQAEVANDTIERYARACSSPWAGARPSEDQINAVLEGLETRVQLLQGPPGTGKTQTTAVATLMRIALRIPVGSVALVSAHTHTAVDNLLLRMQRVEASVRQALASESIVLPPLAFAKVHSSRHGTPLNGVINFPSSPSARIVNGHLAGHVLIVAGTTSALLKLARELNQRRPWSQGVGFQVPLLVVDEASMMVFPHFLALASIVAPTGEVMLAGDHRQLSPIFAHDWEEEDRPPAVVYQPHASAYNAVRDIASRTGTDARAVRRSALELTFRLPPTIIDLISRLYRLDEIELRGLEREPVNDTFDDEGSFRTIWENSSGLFLVLHDERESRQSNEVEATIIEQILEAAGPLQPASVAVITPHRAQRALLTTRLAPFSDVVDLVDTVERLQGGERRTVIVSGTASDPSAISANAAFLLDLNRSNVAFSRAQDRLVVVCSRGLLDHIPPEIEDYESALLWKSLRAICSRVVATETVSNHRVQIFTVPLELRDDTPST